MQASVSAAPRLLSDSDSVTTVTELLMLGLAHARQSSTLTAVIHGIVIDMGIYAGDIGHARGRDHVISIEDEHPLDQTY